MAGGASPPSSREAALTRLCLSCGRCCDGTLFTRVSLEGDEAARMERAGMPVRTADGRASFPQPCSALQTDLTCRVYAERPNTCRAFECLLFRAVKEDEVDVTEALRVVEDVRVRLQSGETPTTEPLRSHLEKHFLGRGARAQR